MRFLRGIACAVCVCSLLCQGPGFALAPSQTSSRDVAPAITIESFHIPEAYGTVKEKFKGSSGKIIVHVQDIHADVQAQGSYAKILEFLYQGVLKNQKKLIVDEGAIGHVDVSAFHMVTDQAVLAVVADYFLKQALINGSEYYAVVKNPEIPIEGIEDKDLYFRTLEKFMTSDKVFQRLHPSWERFTRMLEGLQGRVFEGPLGALMSVVTRYQKGQANVTDYFRALEQAAKAVHKDVGRYAQFQLVIQTLDLQKSVDVKLVEKERALLLDALQRKMVKKELARLVEQSLFFKIGRLAAPDYYDYLKKTALQKGIKPSTYPNVFRYADLVLLQDRIDVPKALAECEQLEDSLCDSLASKTQEKELVRMLKSAKVLEALMRLQLSRAQLAYYLEHKDSLDASGAFVNDLKKFLAQYAVQESAGTWVLRSQPGSQAAPIASTQITSQDLDVVAGIGRDLGPMQEFYDLTQKRDGVLVTNTLRAMDEAGVDVVVQNMGGFHTPGVLEKLRAQNISYVVITPRVTAIPDDAVYMERMTNLQIPLEDLFRVNTDKLQILSIWGDLGTKPITLNVDGKPMEIDPNAEKESAHALIVLAAIAAGVEQGLGQDAILTMLRGVHTDSFSVETGKGYPIVTIGRSGTPGRRFEFSPESQLGRLESNVRLRIGLKGTWVLAKAQEAQPKAQAPPQVKAQEPISRMDGVQAALREMNPVLLLGALQGADAAFLEAHAGELWAAALNAMGGSEAKLSAEIKDNNKRKIIKLLVQKIGLGSFPGGLAAPAPVSENLAPPQSTVESELREGEALYDAKEAYDGARLGYQKDPTPANWALYVQRALAFAKLSESDLAKRDILANIEAHVEVGDRVLMFTRPGIGRRAGEWGIKEMNATKGLEYSRVTDIIAQTQKVIAKVLSEQIASKSLRIKVAKVASVFDDYKNSAFAIRLEKPEGMSNEEFEVITENLLNSVIEEVNRQMIQWISDEYGIKPKGFGLYPGISQPVAAADQKVQAVAQASSATATSSMGRRAQVKGRERRRGPWFKQDGFDESLRARKRAHRQLRGTEFTRFGPEYLSSMTGIDRPWDPEWVVGAMHKLFEYEKQPKESRSPLDDLIANIGDGIENHLKDYQNAFPDYEALVGIVDRYLGDLPEELGKGIFAKDVATGIFSQIVSYSRDIPAYLSKSVAADVRDWEKYAKKERTKVPEVLKEHWDDIALALDQAVNEYVNGNDSSSYEGLYDFFEKSGRIRAGPEILKSPEVREAIREAYHMRLARIVDELTGIHDYIKNWGLNSINQELLSQTSLHIAQETNRIITKLRGLTDAANSEDLLQLYEDPGILEEAWKKLTTDIKNPEFTSHIAFLVEFKKMVKNRKEPFLITFDVKDMGLMNRELAHRNLNWIDRFESMEQAMRKNFLKSLVKSEELSEQEAQQILSAGDETAQYVAFTNMFLQKAGDGVTKKVVRENEKTLARIFKERLEMALKLGVITQAQKDALMSENRLGYIGGDELTIARSKEFMDAVNDERVKAKFGNTDVLLQIHKETRSRAVSIAGAAIMHGLESGSGLEWLKSFKDLDAGTAFCKRLEVFGIRGFAFAKARVSGTEGDLVWNVQFEYRGSVYEASVDLFLQVLERYKTKGNNFPLLMQDFLAGGDVGVQIVIVGPVVDMREEILSDVESNMAAEIKA